jgi:hypothetical protein
MDMEAIEKLTLGARDKRKVKEASDFKLQKKADKVEVGVKSKQAIQEEYLKKLNVK